LPNISLRQELKGKFIQELTHSEKLFFLKKARESITVKGYQVSEDLFHYCYFLTLRERFRRINSFDDAGYLRLLLVEGTRDTENAARLYEEKLEKKKLSTPEADSCRFMEYLSEQQ